MSQSVCELGQREVNAVASALKELSRLRKKIRDGKFCCVSDLPKMDAACKRIESSVLWSSSNVPAYKVD